MASPHADQPRARREVPGPPDLPRSRRTGFAMVEVIIGMLIIALIMLSSTGVLVLGMRQSRGAIISTQVSELMDTQMETLRTMNYTKLSSTYGAYTTANPFDWTATASAQATADGYNLPQDFKLTGAFTVVDSTSSYPRMEVLLTASWRNPTGSTLTQKAYSQFSKNGLSDWTVSGFAN